MTDDEFLYPDCLAAKLDDVEAEAREVLRGPGIDRYNEDVAFFDAGNEPAFRAASDADKRRILDARDTCIAVAQVRSRLAIGDLAGAKRFLGYLGANFSADPTKDPLNTKNTK